MRRALVIAVALAGLLVGTASAGAESGDLRIGSTQDFESPNPLKSVEAINVETQATIMYDQLIGLKPSDQCISYGPTALATGADVTPDGKTITFHLRSGIHWSDGQPFTSADAAWTFNAVLQNKTNQLHGTIEAVKSVSAPDKNTFVLHLATRDSEFLDKLAHPDPAQAHLVEDPDREARQGRRARADGHDGSLRAHEVGEARHHDPEQEREVRHVPQRRQAARRQAHPHHLLREPGLGLSRRQPGPSRLRLRRPAVLGAAREDRQQQERPAGLLPARRLLGDRIQLLPEDRLADLQRPGQGRQDRGRAGPGAAQGGGLRHRPREVHPDRLRRTGHDCVQPDLPALQALLRRSQEHAARLCLRPRQGEGGAEGRRLGLLADPVHEERREGRVRARHAQLEPDVPVHGEARQGRRGEGRDRRSTSTS